MNINWVAIGATVFPNIGGFVGGLFLEKSIPEWYDKLKTPKWTPPNWVFGPVWTFLFCCMGFASYLVWKEGGGFEGTAKLPLIMYGVHLAINWAWSPIFFGMRDVKKGFYAIILLDVAVIVTATLFYNIEKTAGYLYIPYILWLTLASSISYRIYCDNTTSGRRKTK